MLEFRLDQLRLRIPLDDPEEWTIDVTDVTFDRIGQSVRLDIGQSSPMELGPLLGLRGATIERCFVRHSGLLEITFANGTRLTAHPDPRSESWEIRGRVHIVFTPGVELAIWDHDPRNSFSFADFPVDDA
jgi:hypothetical protein